jgi:hypothetical protein
LQEAQLLAEQHRIEYNTYSPPVESGLTTHQFSEELDQQSGVTSHCNNREERFEG